MTYEELASLQLKSIEGYAEEDEEWVIKGFTIKLINGMCDYGDFAGSARIEANLIGGSKQDA